MSFIAQAFLAIVLAHIALCFARYHLRLTQKTLPAATSESGKPLLDQIRSLVAAHEQLQMDMTRVRRLAVCEEIKFNAKRRTLSEELAASKREIEELQAREQRALADIASWKHACWQRIARLEREMQRLQMPEIK